MAQVIETIDVDVPVRVAYNQWTQFEEFPHFMSFVESITQKTDTLTHWKVKIAGAESVSSTPRSPSSTPTSASRGTVSAARRITPASSRSTASPTTRRA
ncbi:hypothetical protein RKD05_002214 [Microbacterium sp. SLBN-111]